MDVWAPVAILYRRGDRYYLDWRENGQRFRRSLGNVTRATAEAVQAEKAAELRGIIAPRSGITCDGLIAAYLGWYALARPTTYRRALSALKPFRERFGALAAEGLEPRQVEMWEVGRTARAASHKALVLAKAAYRRAVRLGTIRTNPMARVTMAPLPVSRAPTYYQPDQLRALYGTAHGALWQFMANTGIRRGEAFKATRSDVRDDALYVESVPSGRTKSGRWRAVPLNADALQALKSLGAVRLVAAEVPDTLSDWFRAEADAAKVGGTLHWLRHTFCTALVQSGVSLHTVKTLAGHSSVTVTEKYAHHAPQQGRHAVDSLAAWSHKQTHRKQPKRASN